MNKKSKRESITEENEKKDENEKNEQINNAITIVEVELSTVRLKNQIKSYIFLFLLSVLYFGAYIFNYYVRHDILRLCRNSIGIIYEIIILYLLSVFILKEK